jgi:hypothetical protein
MRSAKTMLTAGALLAVVVATTSAHAEDIYELKTGAAKATVGAKATTSVTITAKSGWHVNEEAPVSLKLQPAAGITVEKPRLTKADVAQRTKDMARFDVAFTATEPGKKTIAAECSFVMCQASTCKPVRETVTLAVEVAPAAVAKKK